MAITITDTQVQFPSNGNMEGQYIGTSATNTAYPLGSYVFAYNQNNVTTQSGVRNQSSVVYTPRSGSMYNADFGWIESRGIGSVALSGTWVQRGAGYYPGTGGYTDSGPWWILAQRIA